MLESIKSFFKKGGKKEEDSKTKDAAKERLHLVLMQDRANVSVDYLELMKQEIIEVIKKYVDIDEKELDVRLTHKTNSDGTNGAPALYANIPIISIKNEKKKEELDKINKAKDAEKNKVEQIKTVQDKTQENETVQNKTEKSDEEKIKTVQNKTEKNDAKQIKAVQNKTDKNETEQIKKVNNKTEKNKAEQINKVQNKTKKTRSTIK